MASVFFLFLWRCAAWQYCQYQLGRFSSNRFFKLKDVAVRDKVWFAKTNLKDTGITLSEFLTKARHEDFMKARQRSGVTKCWTREGNVYVIGHDGDRHRINWLGDLNTIAAQSQPQSTAVSPRPPVASAKPPAVANETELI
ncbi:Uncharacterized protein OBRU01_25546 [Operophtera brumata]|uniref:Uncharacterized protein n=1 Tax=Operophtera brumata TaxID=104452 RepID=A0A0L7K3B3_OPEBR|nr:Uncharacterized protein OBRU01_25546 [Operophtera brumata]